MDLVGIRALELVFCVGRGSCFALDTLWDGCQENLG